MSGFVHKTIGQMVWDTALRYPGHPALICPESGIRQNYGDFYQTCRSVAKGLMVMGVKRGDSVAVWTTNVPEWIYLNVIYIGRRNARPSTASPPCSSPS